MYFEGRMWEKRGAYRVLVGKPLRESPLGKLRRRWEDMNEVGLQEIGCGILDWIDMSRYSVPGRYSSLLQSALTVSVAYPAFSSVGTGGFFTRGKAAGTQS
jgi:hypothetical protein